ncbi:MAG: type II toxin-antitoxin system Phd/YefM family antitoxin [Myxococcales bacterium]|nr:type II toxin-antitoxin system Phd/YefM family antitoxin [Myxococcales bacterium]
MIRLNVQDAKTHLSRYLAQVEAGEVVVLCRRNVAIAEIRRIDPGRTEPRRTGVMSERHPGWQVPASFDDPLPEWLLDAFDGGGR